MNAQADKGEVARIWINARADNGDRAMLAARDTGWRRVAAAATRRVAAGVLPVAAGCTDHAHSPLGQPLGRRLAAALLLEAAGRTDRAHRPLGRCAAAALLLVAAALAAGLCAMPARADGLEGRFEVRSADLELKDGVYHLNARIDLPVSDAVRHGLADGVPLGLEVDLDIERVRQLLPNSRVAELTQRYHLQYNAVSARYILRNDNSGQQASLGTVDAALEQLAELHGLPVLDKALLSADRRYEASVRAKIDYGSVPFSLRMLMFWVNEWHRESDWYTWTLQP